MSVSSAQSVVRKTFIESLPLVSLHLTERCNSRCITCDYWRHGRRDVSVESVNALLPQLEQLGTRTVLISGGEPLIHPHWIEIARLFRAYDIELWLVTSGLSLAKHALHVSQLFRSVTVSLDGTNREMYAAIRGLDAFEKVCEGIRATVALDVPVSIRVTVQRANYRALPQFVALARELGACQISFLAADVASTHAFGRSTAFEIDAALRVEDLPQFERTLRQMEREHAEAFRNGFIAESPRKLRRLLEYYKAVCGRGDYPPTRCNAPEFSAVIEADGRLKPCFFIEGAETERTFGDVAGRLNGSAMRELRNSIRERRRRECVTCVCSLWRDESERGCVEALPTRTAVAAAL